MQEIHEKKSVKQRWNKLSTKQKVFALSFLSILLIGTSSAVWIFYYAPTETSGYDVTSDFALTFSDNFAFQNADTTNNSITKTESINLTNTNGNISLTAFVDTIITDVVDSCDNANDCAVVVSYEGVPLTNNETIVVPHGDTSISVNTTCAKLSCPQSVSTNISLETPN